MNPNSYPFEERLYFSGKQRVVFAFKKANFDLCGFDYKSKYEKILGCDKKFYADYMRSKYKEGMTDENYGYHGWHIDHIFPLSRCKTVQDLTMWSHYLNTQPLWENENIEKSDHIDDIHLVEEIRGKILRTQGIIDKSYTIIDISDTHPRVGKKKERQSKIINRMSEYDRMRYFRYQEEKNKNKREYKKWLDSLDSDFES